jgi:hypothetical protein
MSFVRPELVARLRPWRETILWGAVTAAGLWLVARSIAPFTPATAALGVVVALGGGGLLRGALRRAALAAEHDAAGIVEVDEGRIAYFAPQGCGFADVRELKRVEIVATGQAGHAWRLTAEDGSRLEIPLGAAGAERIPDALGSLPGIDFRAGVAAIARSGHLPAALWTRPTSPDAARPVPRRIGPH